MEVTYRVFNSADGSIKCHKHEVNKPVETLTNDKFHREIKSLRKQFQNQEKIKIWDPRRFQPLNFLSEEVKENIKKDEGRLKTDLKSKK